MKNKKLTYLLGLVLLVVWGLIIYRIFYAVSGDSDNDLPIASSHPVKEAYNDYTIPKDTTHLLLNYRDPFGLVQSKDTLNTTVKISHSVNSNAAAIKKSAFDWGFIQYSGYIRNPVSKKLIALVSINGKNEMLSEGDTKDQVKLIKNVQDAIKISFNGQIKLIPIKAATP